MPNTILLLPLFAHVLLIAIVWVELFRRRVSFSATQKIDLQSVADAQDAKEVFKPVQAPANNLINLFEIPVLFFVAVLVAFVTNIGDWLLLWFFWGFVALRYIHSFIHLTNNIVMRRFQVYALSTILLWGIWVLMAVRLYA